METIRQKFCCLWAPSFFKMLGCLHARILRILSAVSTRIPTPRKAITRAIRHTLATQGGGCFQRIYNDINGIVGEPGRIRTFDPLIKSQLLYHLSYGPTIFLGTLSIVFKQYPNLPHRPVWHFVSILPKTDQVA